MGHNDRWDQQHDCLVRWGRGDQRLHGYNADTGARCVSGGGTNELMTGTRQWNTGIVARGRIYFAADNKVYAFRLPTATPTPTATATDCYCDGTLPTSTATATATVLLLLLPPQLRHLPPLQARRLQLRLPLLRPQPRGRSISLPTATKFKGATRWTSCGAEQLQQR